MLYRIIGYAPGIVIPTEEGNVTIGDDELAELSEAQADELTMAGIPVLEHRAARAPGRAHSEPNAAMIGGAIEAGVDATLREIFENEDAARAIALQYSVPTKKAALSRDPFRDEAREWR
jgi:hypothetical protein